MCLFFFFQWRKYQIAFWRGNCQLPTQIALKTQLKWLRFTVLYLCHTQVKVDPLVCTMACRLLDLVSTSLPLYFIFCVTLWRFLRGEGLCLHCIERSCNSMQIMWSNTEDHVIQYKRLCDPIQEIMWSNRSCDPTDHVIQWIMWSNGSCDPIQEIMWSNKSCDPIHHVIQHRRSCDTKINLTITHSNYFARHFHTVNK